MNINAIINKFNHYYLIFPILILTVLLASCSKDIPVKPEDPVLPDTVDIYSWRTEPFPYFNDIFVPDTSNIYVCGNRNTWIWDGSANPPKVINFNDNNFKPELVKGFDNSSVFVGGPYGMNDACVKRIQNNVVTETYYFDTANYINWLFPISPNDIYISLPVGILAHYKNGQINNLYLPNKNYYPKIFRYKDGNLYVFAEKPGNGSNIPSFLNCYRIENEQLTFARSDSMSQYPPYGLTFRLYQIDKDIVMYDGRGMLMKFSENGWEYYTGYPGFDILGLGGNKIDSMIAFTFTNGVKDIQTWNGTRWKKEILSNQVIPYYLNISLYFEQISVIGNNVYVMLGDLNGSFLLVGRRKDLF